MIIFMKKIKSKILSKNKKHMVRIKYFILMKNYNKMKRKSKKKINNYLMRWLVLGITMKVVSHQLKTKEQLVQKLNLL